MMLFRDLPNVKQVAAARSWLDAREFNSRLYQTPAGFALWLDGDAEPIACDIDEAADWLEGPHDVLISTVTLERV
jgi:hypothetical protein